MLVVLAGRRGWFTLVVVRLGGALTDSRPATEDQSGKPEALQRPCRSPARRLYNEGIEDRRMLLPPRTCARTKDSPPAHPRMHGRAGIFSLGRVRSGRRETPAASVASWTSDACHSCLASRDTSPPVEA